MCHIMFTLDFRDGCNNQIDGLKVGIYPVKKLLVYCYQNFENIIHFWLLTTFVDFTCVA